MSHRNIYMGILIPQYSLQSQNQEHNPKYHEHERLVTIINILVNVDLKVFKPAMHIYLAQML